MLFTDEVKDMQELTDKLCEMEQDFGKIKVAVVCFIFDKNGNLILHRRGAGARDEVGKLLAVGGSVNSGDLDFRSALTRELKEEVGNQCNITINDFIGAQLDSKIDRATKELTNWIILAYKGKMISGELINNEPERCVGFERAKMSKFSEEDLAKTASIFIQKMLNDR